MVVLVQYSSSARNSGACEWPARRKRLPAMAVLGFAEQRKQDKNIGGTGICEDLSTESTLSLSCSKQAVVLNAIVQQLAAYTQHDLIPVSKMSRVPSLQRLGYSQMRGKTGYKQRPQMLNNDLTLRVLEDFLQQGGDPGHDAIVISKENLDKADLIDIPYVEMEQPTPMRVF